MRKGRRIELGGRTAGAGGAGGGEKEGLGEQGRRGQRLGGGNREGEVAGAGVRRISHSSQHPGKFCKHEWATVGDCSPQIQTYQVQLWKLMTGFTQSSQQRVPVNRAEGADCCAPQTHRLESQP